MSIKLEKGQKIEVIIYYGSSAIEAESAYKYLDDFWKTLTPAPIKGLDLKIFITEVIATEVPDLILSSLQYKIVLKGELVR